MDFLHSDKIDPSKYKTDGLCDGIDLRRHKDPSAEIRGVKRCQNDWSRLVGPLGDYKATLGEPFSFIGVTIPETLPERREIVSYANEFAFLYDDAIMEDVDQSLEAEDRSRILDDFSREQTFRPNLNGTREGAARTVAGIKQIQSQIFNEMMAIDKPKALTTIKLWQEYVKKSASRQRSEPFLTLDDYLPYRMTEAAELFWFGLVTFGMNLAIPEHEMDLCKQLGKPAWAAVVLTNDIYSWAKEREAAARAGDTHVINAIWVFMKEHSISETQAFELCRQKNKELVIEAKRVADQTKRDLSLSRDLRAYTEAMLYTVSGNLVWSIYCPRYHPAKENDDNGDC